MLRPGSNPWPPVPPKRTLYQLSCQSGTISLSVFSNSVLSLKLKHNSLVINFCIQGTKCSTILFALLDIIWAPSSEFVSSSIPSWQILTAHAQPFRGARDMGFCLKVPLDSLLLWASSERSGETARMRRLAWTFAARIGDKYQIRLTRSIWHVHNKYQLLCTSCTSVTMYQQGKGEFHPIRNLCRVLPTHGIS